MLFKTWISYSSINSTHKIIVIPGSSLLGSADISFNWSRIDTEKWDEAGWLSSTKENFINAAAFIVYNGVIDGNKTQLEIFRQRPALYIFIRHNDMGYYAI